MVDSYRLFLCRDTMVEYTVEADGFRIAPAVLNSSATYSWKAPPDDPNYMMTGWLLLKDVIHSVRSGLGGVVEGNIEDEIASWTRNKMASDRVGIWRRADK